MRGLKVVYEKRWFAEVLMACLLIGNGAMAQADLDFLSDVRVKATDEAKPAPGVDAAQAMVDELVAAAKDARDAASDARMAAGEAMESAGKADDATKAAKKAAEDLATNSLVSSPFGGVTIEEVDAAIAKALADRPAFTESEIREFAKDEIKKHLEAKVKMPDGAVKTVESEECVVTANGYEGVFKVPAGGRVIAVEGRPVVSGGAAMRTGAGVVYFGRTEDIQMRTIPNQVQGQPQVIRFNSVPQRGPRFSAPATCRNVWNAATGQFERRCN